MKFLIKISIILLCILIFNFNGANAQDEKAAEEGDTPETKSAEEIREFDREIEKETEEMEKVLEEDKIESRPDVVKKKKEFKTKTTPQTKSRIRNNYYGINLIYNGSTLLVPDNKVFLDPIQESSTGFGFDIFYQSFISDAFSYQVLFEFLYNSFENRADEGYYNPPSTNVIYPKYNQTERFYNFIGGFVFSYHVYMEKLFGVRNNFLKNMFPYFSTGLLSSSIYKSIEYEYDDPGANPWVGKDPESKWLPASLSFPFSFGIKFMLNSKNIINLNFTYLYILFNETSGNYGYNNITNFKLGWMHTLDFKL